MNVRQKYIRRALAMCRRKTTRGVYTSILKDHFRVKVCGVLVPRTRADKNDIARIVKKDAFGRKSTTFYFAMSPRIRRKAIAERDAVAFRRSWCAERLTLVRSVVGRLAVVRGRTDRVNGLYVVTYRTSFTDNEMSRLADLRGVSHVGRNSVAFFEEN